MKIMMTGGGSGGHITPILAVADELKKLDPTTNIVYVGQRGDGFALVVGENQVIDETFMIRAGKFRRYHGEGLKQLLDLPTVGKNIRDLFYTCIGLWQSYWLIGKVKPDIIFCKGGFVGVPVGLAAAIRRVPYITHDSDAIPGLANRIIARWAACHAVALPAELYPYQRSRTVNVGVPISDRFKSVDAKLQETYKKELGLDKFEQIVFVTGGGLGAEIINDAVIAVATDLLEALPGLCIIHMVGHKHEVACSNAYTKLLPTSLRRRVIVRDFVSNLYLYSGAADVIVARAGATTFAEFAQQGRACIIIPNPILAGGHQVKNAQAYAENQSVILLEEKQLRQDKEVLGRNMMTLLQHPAKRADLIRNIRAFARPDSAQELAKLIIEIQEGRFRSVVS